jgi:ribosomal protein S18 acetylase RimI-like enzyme
MESQAWSVRLATPADFEAVSAVFAQENAFHVGLVPQYISVADPPIPRDEFDDFLADEKSELFVAEGNGRLIGVALLSLRSAEEKPFLVSRNYAYVVDVAVLESHRGRGVGRALMHAVDEWAAGKGVSDIELSVWEANRRAREFYESLGYESVQRKMAKRTCEGQAGMAD